MPSTSQDRVVSRRTALAGASALGLTLAFASRAPHVIAQEATPASPPATPVEGQTVTVNGADLYYEVHGPRRGGHPAGSRQRVSPRPAGNDHAARGSC